jgi:hypothetical protein
LLNNSPHKTLSAYSPVLQNTCYYTNMQLYSSQRIENTRKKKKENK